MYFCAFMSRLLSVSNPAHRIASDAEDNDVTPKLNPAALTFAPQAGRHRVSPFSRQYAPRLRYPRTAVMGQPVPDFTWR